jgi:quercetin dioxygenase-like cupin family protein
MIYQELHLGDPPYIIGYRENAPCPIHCHPEIELFYCTYGEYRIRIDGQSIGYRKAIWLLSAL